MAVQVELLDELPAVPAWWEEKSVVLMTTGAPSKFAAYLQQMFYNSRLSWDIFQTPSTSLERPQCIMALREYVNPLLSLWLLSAFKKSVTSFRKKSHPG